jgi:starch synthase
MNGWEESMNILFTAAENGALPGGKVGGIGDVVRDLPPALAAQGCRVTVVTPSHGFLHRGPAAQQTGVCSFLYGGRLQEAEIYTLAPLREDPGVTQIVLHHPDLGAGGDHGRNRLYAHDPPDRPFFTDGSRFALFSAAVAAAAANRDLGPFDILHLHDWHTALVALLARLHPVYRSLADCRIVFSIHNLAFQGVRPLRGSASSLEAWFPELRYPWETVADPRWPECVNPMAVGIRLADRVHTVSPSYAAEILRPDRKPAFFGGEGLEADLMRANEAGRLVGILNGCPYPAPSEDERVSFGALRDMIRREAVRWSGEGESVPAAQFIAFARAVAPDWGEAGPDLMLTSVGRVGEQKMLLLRHPGSDGRAGLPAILEGLGEQGCYVLLGSGDADYTRWISACAARYPNFIFVNGYSDRLAQTLYGTGDLFLMPSSFEPCGLSQMLAMRAGQPCLVHAVGGLKDTVRHDHNGFCFQGDTLEAQVDHFVAATLAAAAIKRNQPEVWAAMRARAAATRFTWTDAAARYQAELYRPAAGGAAGDR